MTVLRVFEAGTELIDNGKPRKYIQVVKTQHNGGHREP